MNNDAIIRDFDRIATVADQFDSGSDRYDDFLCSLVPGEAKSIADIGCGLGRLALKLVYRDRSVLGIDLSTEMITRATKNAVDAHNVSFLCGDFLTDERLDKQFDCVVTAATLHHVPVDLGVPRLIELVRDGGRLIIHDLRENDGIIQDAKAFIALAQDGFTRFLRTGSPFSPQRVRHAWKEHGDGEKYLTLPEVHRMVDVFLPGALVYGHWRWRYTVVWDNRYCS